MTAAKKFIFDRSKNSLYEPDGTFLKKVWCPYSRAGDRLTIKFDEKSHHGTCSMCDDVILNIDTLDAQEIVDCVRKNPMACLHGTSQSGRIIFLDSNPKESEYSESEVPPELPMRIETARTLEDINRAVD